MGGGRKKEMQNEQRMGYLCPSASLEKLGNESSGDNLAELHSL
jgi:hypothetical protein